MPATWDNQARLVVDVGKPYGKIPEGRGYGLDGDGDGKADIMNPYDSVPAAARYLCANGAGDPNKLPDAIFAYNHAWWYVYGGLDDHGHPFEGVIPLANRLADITSLLQGGGSGDVEIAPGANLPGKPLKPELLAFARQMAAIYGRKLVITTGTNHSYYTVDGNVSDHAVGEAADFGMVANGGSDDSPVGDAIATACLVAAGDPPAEAKQLARIGGLWTRFHNRMRIQCIWKTNLGGNHHNHVHAGVKPM
jgi:hypothetical protein